jgi:plastocyanin
MRRAVAVVLACALVGIAAAGATAATTRIKIGDNFFVRDGGRPTVTVTAGETVRWVWTGKMLHNVIVLRGPTMFHSPFKRKGEYRRTFDERGTYIVYCSVHGYPDQWMKLVVR